MKSRNLLILLLFFNNCLHAEYESMQKYKRNLQTRPSEQKSMQSKIKTDLYVIEFKDLNAMDTYSLEKKYNLRLVQCIADGICVFRNENKQIKNFNRQNIIDSEENIKNIKPYVPYRFRIF